MPWIVAWFVGPIPWRILPRLTLSLRLSRRHDYCPSAEGHEFIVDRKCATVSKTIEAMLAGQCSPRSSGADPLAHLLTEPYCGPPGVLPNEWTGNFAESRGEIKFPEISTQILEKVIQYLYYKVGRHSASQLRPRPFYGRGRQAACQGRDTDGSG